MKIITKGYVLPKRPTFKDLKFGDVFTQDGDDRRFLKINPRETLYNVTAYELVDCYGCAFTDNAIVNPINGAFVEGYEG